MRKLLFILFCLVSLASKGQVYQSMPQYGYGPVKRFDIDSSLTIPTTCGVPTLRTTLTKKAAIAFDSCNNKFYKYNPKTATWSEISGSSLDTTSLSNRINGKADTSALNLKLNITDTANMLTPYLRKVDTASLSNRINLKLNISDTTSMLSPYLKSNLGVKYTDTATMLSPYLRKIDTTNKWVNSIYRKNGKDSIYFNIGGTEYKIKDSTANVSGFVPYTGATQDVDLDTHILNAQSIGVKGTNGNGHIDLRHQSSNASATGQTTALFADANGDLKWKNAGNYYTTLTTKQTADRVYTFQNKSYTLADSSDVANKVNISDTSTMLTNYAKTSAVNLKVNISDTASMLTGYTRKTRSISTTAPLSGGGDLSADRTLSITQATTSTNGYLSSTDWNTFNNKQSDWEITLGHQALGSTIKSVCLTAPTFASITTINGITSGQIRFVAIYLPQAVTLTGVKWFQSTNGSYTANNYNGVGLYSYSAGTLTLVASSTNDGNIWQQGTGMMSKAFSSTYSASAGVYFIAALYSASSVTTQPVLIGTAALNGTANTGDFTNSAKLSGQISGQTALPSPTQTMSGVSANTTSFAFWVY